MLLREATLSYAVLLRRTMFRYADLCCAAQCHAELRSAAQAELRNALLSYAVLHGATLR